MKESKFLSTSELAKILGISRIAVFKKIKEGKIKAFKVGRTFVVDRKDLGEITGTVLKNSEKKEIEASVQKLLEEYEETFRLLGKE
ncbi:MAG: helix-turn-helix domain-containing protein [Patescibacteria group bacterium]